MKVTLNQLIGKLQLIATNHEQINSFFFGDIADLGSESPVQYPVLFADVAPSNFSYKVIGLNLQLMVMDIVKKDLSNENDVLSDCLQMMEDVIIELRNPSEIFLIQDSISLTPFMDSQGDEVAGWTANITINIQSTYNSCAIPSN
jgi:hypothetical protein